MQPFLLVVNTVFGLLFRPFRSVSPVYGLVVFSFLTSALMVLAFRYTSNQKAIRRAKDRIQAHVLAVRLFQDQLGVVLRSYASIAGATLAYFRHSLPPLAWMAVPILLILPQLEMRFGRASPQPRESLLLNVQVAPNISLDDVSLRLPAGLRISAPPVRIPERREISWRLETDGYGDFAAELAAAGRVFTKQMTVSADLAPLPVRRVGNPILQALLYPSELPLPSGSPLEAIEVRYRPRGLEFGGYRIEWWILFLVFSFLSAMALKAVTRTEF